tara:strand:- start:63 stop:590 length:528 start_codon:yes stop_codon:yes gene_type:complete
MKLSANLYQSDLIIQNKEAFIYECNYGYTKISNKLKAKDTTWSYKEYNIFSVMAGSVLFYNLFLELSAIIKEYHNKQEPLWMQSWLNFHDSNELLDWHNHAWPFHGYISIDPKNTSTVFRDFEIKNETGNIYIGEGQKEHKVISHEEFSSPRITIGFDVTSTKNVYPDMFSLIQI